jgi:hypothetical protein
MRDVTGRLSTDFEVCGIIGVLSKMTRSSIL